jgi:DNA-binding NarL/FixJ family response regulator
MTSPCRVKRLPTNSWHTVFCENTMRILVADHEASTRSALRVFLRAHPDTELVAEAANLAELLTEIEAEAPDVVILDWDILGEDIDAVLNAVRQSDSRPSIVAMSIRAENREAAIETGIDGFAHKGESPERLLEAVRAAHEKRKSCEEPE